MVVMIFQDKAPSAILFVKILSIRVLDCETILDANM